MFTDFLRIIFSFLFFSYASYKDIKERRVSRKVWYILSILGILILIPDIFFGRSIFLILFSISFSLLLGYGFYYLGAFGGADKYAVICLGILFPFYPSFFGFPIFKGNFFIFAILINTVLIGIFYPVKLFLENIYRKNFSLFMIVGKKVPVSELHIKYGKILKTTDGKFYTGLFSNSFLDLDFIRDYINWKEVDNLEHVSCQKLDLKKFIQETEWNSKNLEKDEEKLREICEKDEVWISPGIPFIFPLFLGLLSAVILGNIIIVLFRFFFGFEAGVAI